MTASELSSINRANAAHSTGPQTPEGKQRASMNALKHGLTGQRMILQPHEHEAYRELTESLRAELQPKTTLELQLVQKIIDSHMRLNRVAALDNNLLNFGLMENLADADGVSEPADDTEIAHAQARSWIAHQTSFDKLGRYEGRLARQLLAYTKEFERLQTLRLERERAYAEQRRFDALTTRITSLKTAAIAKEGQDLSPENLTAEQSQWSSTWFRNAASAATPDTPQSTAEPLNPIAA